MFARFIKEKRVELKQRFPKASPETIAQHTAGERGLLSWVIATLFVDWVGSTGYCYLHYLKGLPDTEPLTIESWIEIFSSLACFHWLGITMIFEAIGKIEFKSAREIHLKSATALETSESVRFKNAFLAPAQFDTSHSVFTASAKI
jgi:hypothetical protein